MTNNFDTENWDLLYSKFQTFFNEAMKHTNGDKKKSFNIAMKRLNND